MAAVTAKVRISRDLVQDPSLFDNYQCPHCKHLLNKAVQSTCGHWLCQDCADELMTDRYIRATRKSYIASRQYN